jgi:cytoskeletal protein CcmA (bactofilin family)
MAVFGRTQKPEADAIEVILGPRASFAGELRSDTSVRIDGAVDGGRVETPANVILTETARAHCDITAKTVSIRGLFRGVIRADRVELLEGSQVYGALHVNSIYMDDGVLLRAELNIQGALVDDAGALPRPDSSAAIPVISAPRSPLG